MRHKRSALGVILFAAALTAPIGARAAIITPAGIFSDCSDARFFRDGQLKDSLDYRFKGYDASKEEMYASFLTKYSDERNKLQPALRKINNDKKRIVYIALAQVATTFFLEEYTKKVIGALSLSASDKAILEAVLNKSNGLKVDVAAAITTGNIDGQGIALGQVKSLADIILAATKRGLIAPPVAIAGQIYTVGSVGIPAAAEWLDRDIEQKGIEAIISSSFDATKRIVNRSSRIAIEEINRTRESIDSQCR